MEALTSPCSRAGLLAGTVEDAETKIDLLLASGVEEPTGGPDRGAPASARRALERPGFAEGLAWFRAARGGRAGRESSPGTGCRRAGLAVRGRGPSTVRGPRLHPLWPLPHARVGAPSVSAEIRAGVDTGQGRSTEEAGVLSQASCRKRKQAASRRADLPEAAAPAGKAASCPRMRPAGPLEGTCHVPGPRPRSHL